VLAAADIGEALKCREDDGHTMKAEKCYMSQVEDLVELVDEGLEGGWVRFALSHFDDVGRPQRAKELKLVLSAQSHT
jgi:hypothetical protein